jgi:hypothetical protein
MVNRVKQALNGTGSHHPRVVVAERVIRKIARGASLYMDEETAEALVGLVVPNDQGEPDLYVLDTIAPDQSAIERASMMVEQGDDLQDEIMYSLAINWRRFRELRRRSYGNALAGKWDLPLRYLGDWHKQPGGMFWPSGGDLQTAQAIVREETNNMPQLLAPIVTLAPPWDPEQGPPGDEFDVYATQPDGPDVRINFWYLSRRMRQFVAARPEIVADDSLPSLPPLNWHLTDHARFHEETERLGADGLAVSVTEHDADDVPPMELCFMVGRMGGSHVLILVTGQDYPASQPSVRRAPMIKIAEGEDMFARLWAESEPLPADQLPTWEWTPDKYLIDLVQAIEGQPVADSASAPAAEAPAVETPAVEVPAAEAPAVTDPDDGLTPAVD